MKENSWYIKIAMGLITLSLIFYAAQLFIFHDEHNTFFYMLQDLAFVPVNVLLVTLIIDRLLKKREKQSLLNKMNMVIGVFFNDTGSELIKIFGNCIPNIGEVNKELQITAKWNDRDFNRISQNFKIKPDQFMLNNRNLTDLKEFLEKKKDGLLNMLANPNLLEHDSFTNLLWAVFHVADELGHRSDFNNLPKTDADHLRGDIVRAYTLIISEWTLYMKHLKNAYPYLFSLAVRTNPFTPEVVITVFEK
ncbi:MAG TPA: hypothetical protein VMU29_10540 [Smithella sp.]|nr:hypothetical protein [Smithella sp.]